MYTSNQIMSEVLFVSTLAAIYLSISAILFTTCNLQHSSDRIIHYLFVAVHGHTCTRKLYFFISAKYMQLVVGSNGTRMRYVRATMTGEYCLGPHLHKYCTSAVVCLGSLKKNVKRMSAYR